MDSKRALRSTLVTVVSLTAITGGTANVASADTEVDHQGSWRTDVEVVHEGSWQTDAEVVHQGSWRTEADAPEVRQRTWHTDARPEITHRAPKDRNKKIALGLVVQRAWSFREFRCLDSLWTRESNWNHRAYNRSSGAYGIPQALPAGKMSGAGHDWRDNPTTQIRWGLRYIQGRYGKPCGAWGHFRSYNWY